MRKLERRRKLRTKGHFFAAFASNAAKFVYIPSRFLLNSVIFPVLSLRMFQGLAAIALVFLIMLIVKSHVLDRWLDRPPSNIEIVLAPGPLRNAVEARANEALDLGKRRKLSRVAVIENLRASLASFPAISSARIQSSLSGQLTVSVQVHRVLFAIGEKDGNKIYFNHALRIIGASSPRSEIVGLEPPPFYIQSDGVRLIQDKSGAARLVRQSAGNIIQMNVPFYFRSAHDILEAVKSGRSDTETKFFVEPSQTVSFSDEAGFNVCLATDESELKSSLPPKGCVKIILGPQFDEQSLSKILKNLAAIIKRDAPESIDLRVAGRAFLKPNDIAVRQGQNSE
jgi:hypothetical protein